MKFRALFRCLMLFIMVCTAQAQLPDTLPAAGRLVTAETVLVHSNLPPYLIRRTTFNDFSTLSLRVVRIYEISRLRDSTLHETITDTSVMLNSDSVLDVNFDGYKDLKIDLDSEEPVNIGQPSKIWLFNPQTERFEYSDEFSNHSELTVNPLDSTILTQVLFYKGNGGSYQTYKVVDGHLKLVQDEYRDAEYYLKQIAEDDSAIVIEKEEAVDTTKDGWITVVRSKLVKNVLRPVSKVIEKRLNAEPTERQKERGIVEFNSWGTYILRREEHYSYSTDAHGRLFMDITAREVKNGRWFPIKRQRRHIDS